MGLRGAVIRRSLSSAGSHTAWLWAVRQSGLKDAGTHHEISCPRSFVTVSFLPQPEMEAETLKVSQNYIKEM